MIQGLLVSFSMSPAIGQATAMAAARGRARPSCSPNVCPGGLQARMLDGPERDGFAEARDAATFDVGDREPRMASADIGRDQLHHSPAAASIADAPRSAPSAPWRIRANSSRPVPNGGGGAAASSRTSHSPSSTSAVSSPRLAQSRTMSPSRSLAMRAAAPAPRG